MILALSCDERKHDDRCCVAWTVVWGRDTGSAVGVAIPSVNLITAALTSCRTCRGSEPPVVRLVDIGSDSAAINQAEPGCPPF
jgi:hypothetical protein